MTSQAIRVLIVERDRATIEVLTGELRQAGFELAWDAVESEADFTAKLAGDPDVILAATRVPGFEAVRLLELLSQGDAATPVILVDSGLSEEVIAWYLKRGAVDFIPRERLARLGPMLGHIVREKRLQREKHQLEVALRASDERYRIFSELASEYAYSFVVQPDGRLRREWVLGAFTRITGYTAEELDLLGWEALVVPDDLEATRKLTQEVLAGKSANWDTRLRTKSGQIRWVRLQARPVWNRTVGRVIRIYGAVRDVTESRPAEEMLRSRTYQQSALSQLGQLALSGAELETLMDEALAQIGEVLELPLAFVLESFPDREAVVPRACLGWTPAAPDECIFLTPELQAGYTLVRREPVLVEDLNAHSRFRQDPLLRMAGALSGVTVLISGRQRPFGVLGVHDRRPRSYTQDDLHFLQAMANVLSVAVERKRVEEALQSSELRYRELFENAHDIIYVHDLRGSFTAINKAAEKITGYAREEASTMNILDLVAPGYREQARQLLQDELDGRGGGADEIEILTKDRRRVPVEVSMRVIERNGKPVAVQGIARDVSERRRSESELAVLREIASLAASGNRNELLGRVQQRIVDLLPCDAVASFSIEAAGGEPSLVSQYGIPAELHPAANALGVALEQTFRRDFADRSTILINEIDRYPWLCREPYRALHLSALVVVPLDLACSSSGALVVLSALGGRPFEENQVRLVERIARQLELAMRVVS